MIAGWVRDWLPEALDAAAALAPVADAVGVDAARARERVSRYAGVLLAEAGLPECCELVGFEPPPEVVAEVPVPRRREQPAPRSRRRRRRLGRRGASTAPMTTSGS